MSIIDLNWYLWPVVWFEIGLQNTLTKPDILWNVNVQIATVCFGYIGKKIIVGRDQPKIKVPQQPTNYTCLVVSDYMPFLIKSVFFEFLCFLLKMCSQNFCLKKLLIFQKNGLQLSILSNNPCWPSKIQYIPPPLNINKISICLGMKPTLKPLDQNS